MAATVMIVDDEPLIGSSISRILGRHGYSVLCASDGREALELLAADSPDVVLSDVSMPVMGGLELLREMKALGLTLPTVMMSGASTVGDAVEALKLGALDFIEKPIQSERLLATLENCLRYVRLSEAHRALQSEVGVGDELLGESPAMLRLKGMIDRVAPSEGRVLILGENGTGKELVAAAVHDRSARRSRPLVKINCSAVPKDLIESELFGHERGAFTGAVKTRRGKFEQADGGILFLDEVGDMPQAMQPKLLRVLQEAELERVGGNETYNVDVRVLAATNRNLSEMVDRGEFREDLYYRLSVVTLRTPPLRERKEDIPLLVERFAARAASRNGRRRLDFSPGALEALREHDFPGNIRELQNLVEHLAILSPTDTVEAAQVSESLHRRASRDREPEPLYHPGKRLADLVQDAEKRIVEEAIRVHGNNRSAAARELGVERSHFYKKCKKLGVMLGDDVDG